MARLISDRAERTAGVVMLPSSLEDPTKAPPGLYRVGLVSICGSIFAFFTALIIAYLWRARTAPFWDPIRLPPTLWLSTGIILTSSVVLEVGRRLFGRGHHREAAPLFVINCGMAHKDLIAMDQLAPFVQDAFGFGSAKPRTIGCGLLLRSVPRGALLELLQIDHVPHAGPHYAISRHASRRRRPECAPPRSEPVPAVSSNPAGSAKMRSIDNRARRADAKPASNLAGRALASSVAIQENPHYAL